MPSPLAHSAVALLLAPWALRAVPRAAVPRRVGVAAMVLVGAVAPDLDIALGFAVGANGFVLHGGYSHSLAAALAYGLAAAAVMWSLGWLSPLRGFAFGSAAYGSHLLLDAVNYGRGIALLWPLSGERYSAPVRLFYGVRHSMDAPWSHHVVTLATELLFVAVVAIAAWKLHGLPRLRGLDPQK
jgi:membrane-bound metal-dependent hydrolase YbcI (DUF457 family)